MEIKVLWAASPVEVERNYFRTWKNLRCLQNIFTFSLLTGTWRRRLCALKTPDSMNKNPPFTLAGCVWASASISVSVCVVVWLCWFTCLVVIHQSHTTTQTNTLMEEQEIRRSCWVNKMTVSINGVWCVQGEQGERLQLLGRKLQRWKYSK